MNQRISVRRMTWRSAPEVLCEHRLSNKLYGMLYKLLKDPPCYMILNVILL